MKAAMFTALMPGNVIGAPEMKPWSLPKAIKLPVNVRKPKKVSSPSAVSVTVDR